MKQSDPTPQSRLHSWVASANLPGTDFPLENLPYGVFQRPGASQPQVGVAIGDQILDLQAATAAGCFSGAALTAAMACSGPSLNPFLALGQPAWHALRVALTELLTAGSSAAHHGATLLVPMTEVTLLVPMQIGDYTDFYASLAHATNVGSMFRPDNPLLPNYKYVPIGYHGRASSIIISGTPVRRPWGQTRGPQATEPTFGPSQSLDYEAEVGCVVGPGNPQGTPIRIDQASSHLFGLCLVNDWSARDLQTWEYQPLGPFLAKSFATTISPWIVTMEALAPFRAPAYARPPEDPAPLPYLNDPVDQATGGIDLQIEVYLRSAAMRAAGIPALQLSHSQFTSLYWTVAQLLTHHTSNGCNLQAGDMLASGTVSGSDTTARGCLLELTWRGSEPLHLPTGEERRFLEDGDEITLRGFCERPGTVRIGFGECQGRVEAALTY